MFDRLLTTVRNRFSQLGVPSFPCAQLLVYWGGVQTGISGFDHNPVEYARHCTCPVLMLQGENDPSAKLEEGLALYDNLPGVKRFETFPGAHHEFLFGYDGKRWTAVVVPFLGEIRGNEASDSDPCKPG